MLIIKLIWSNKFGLNINGRELTNLSFADDVSVLAKPYREIQEMVNELTKASRDAGPQIRTNKTKVMTNR